MKIIWLCNQKLPAISAQLGEVPEVFGGWLNDMAYRLLEEPQKGLVLLFPHSSALSGSIENLTYYSFLENSCEDRFLQILQQEQPDLIHIWGTEFKHTLQMISACKKSNLLDRTVISIQGLVSINALHYHTGLPHNVVTHRTFHEWVRGGNIRQAQLAFVARGNNEIAALKEARHVIGRTDFDRACVLQCNPDITYHFCNETLRRSFYEKKWSIEGIRRHSIFVSQCSYPVKGFHYVIEALSVLIKQYPDVHVYTTGPDIMQQARDILRVSTYTKYLVSLIRKYGLENHITFLGTLPEEAMCAQYLKANVFVSASTIENSPNSVGEAMLVGCPVVSSFVGGVPAMLEHGKEGFLYQGDAPYMLAYYVDKVFRDDALAQSISNSARTKAMLTHDPENNFNQLMRIYHDLMS